MPKRIATVGDWLRVIFWCGTGLERFLSFRGMVKLNLSLELCYMDAVRLREWDRKLGAKLEAKADKVDRED